MLASLSNACQRIGRCTKAFEPVQSGNRALKKASPVSPLIQRYLASNSASAVKLSVYTRHQSVLNSQRRLYSSRLRLIEEEDEGVESVTRSKGRGWLEEAAEEDEQTSYDRELSNAEEDESGGDWGAWDPELHGWLSALHVLPMTMEMAKLVWSDYRGHVQNHPEICQFLPLMYRQLSPYLYFDHLENLYSDIVVTGNLSTVIGRDMVKLYTRRGDLQNAEVIVHDLRQAGLDVSGSTMAMLVRLNGASGNIRKVWQCFDEQATKPIFRDSPFPYLLGSLFLALRRLPGAQEAHVLSLFHLMASGEEYHPNSPEYYKWLEEQNLQEPTPEHDVPDFPLPEPVRFPAPDTFCFSAALLAIHTVKGAKIVWEYAQKLRRVTQHVWANYIICLADIDIAVAVEEYRQFSLTGYAEKGWNTSAKLRAELISRCVDANDLESLNLVIEEKINDGVMTIRDAAAILTILLHKGDKPAELMPQVLPLCNRFKLNASAESHIYRTLILEYLKVNQPDDAETMIDSMLQNGHDLHFHHWTPLPLWYLHQWTGTLRSNSDSRFASISTKSSDDTPKAVIPSETSKSKFEEFHRRLMNSASGPSAFYICAVAMNHPSESFVQETIDEAVSVKIAPLQIVASLLLNKPPFDRAYMIIQHLVKCHNIRIEPLLAQQLVRWAVQDKKYAAAFEITQSLTDALLESFKQANASSTGSSARPTLHIKGSWIYNFSSTVLNPLGISTPLHAYYRYNKYSVLSEEEIKTFKSSLTRWQSTAKRNGFVERTFTYNPDQPMPRPHSPKLPPKFNPKHGRTASQDSL